MDQLPRFGKRELICLLLFTCNYVVSVFERFPLPLGAWDGLRYFFISALNHIKTFFLISLTRFSQFFDLYHKRFFEYK